MSTVREEPLHLMLMERREREGGEVAAARTPAGTEERTRGGICTVNC